MQKAVGCWGQASRRRFAIGWLCICVFALRPGSAGAVSDVPRSAGGELDQIPARAVQDGVPHPAASLLSPDPVIKQMLDQVTTAAVLHYEAQLSGVLPLVVDGAPYTLTTRHTDSGLPLEKATQFAADALAARSYTVAYHTWSQSGHAGRNVIGQRTGVTAPEQIYIIGAHLDDMPRGGTAPGADDNATGASAVLVAADIMSRYQWGCTLRFALWTGEEQGLLGSSVYAEQSKADGETIKGYLNLDMLGYNAIAPREVNLFWSGTSPGSEQLADLFTTVVSVYGLDLIPYKYDAMSDPIGNYSDNSSFWRQGYPAILVIEDYFGDFTPYYHTPADQLATLDLDYFTAMVQAAVGTFAHMTGCLLDAPGTRTWIPLVRAP